MIPGITFSFSFYITGKNITQLTL